MSKALLTAVFCAGHCGILLSSDFPHDIFNLLLKALNGFSMSSLSVFGFLCGSTYLLFKLLDALPESLLVRYELNVQVFQLLHTSFKVVEVDLHLMFQPNVASNVCLQLLKHLFVLFWWLRVL